MRMVDLIEKKQDKEVLTSAEINWIIDGYTNERIPDYQMSALLMVHPQIIQTPSENP